MPADGVHLAALADARPDAFGSTRFGATRLMNAARVGALFIDLPYYERFWLTLAAHLAGTSLSWTKWGSRFHELAPITFGTTLLQRSRVLMQTQSTRDEGLWLEAFALGYFCHAAIDRKMHPLVNRLAAKRPEGRIRAHQEVEKLQSILFHRERFGREMLGQAELADYMVIDASPLWRSAVLFDCLRSSTAHVLGKAVTRKQLERWSDGYITYVRLMCSFLGRRAATEEQLSNERQGVYDAVHFPKRFDDAVAYSRRCMEAAAIVSQGGEARALHRTLPEGTLDGLDDETPEPPKAPPRRRKGALTSVPRR
jgi:hypothetical protein